MKWGNQTHWNADKETIEQWLERESEAQEKVKNPCCPHCGYIEREWWEFSELARDYEVEDYEMDCGNCSKKYFVNKETQVRFESRRARDEGE